MTSPNENYTSWHCGMKVVVVDGAPVGLHPTFNYPEFGEVYTIRSMFIGAQGRLLLRLVEVVNHRAPHIDGKIYEPGFEAEFFRPVQTRKTDISIFQRILSNPHKKIHKVEGERV